MSAFPGRESLQVAAFKAIGEHYWSDQWTVTPVVHFQFVIVRDFGLLCAVKRRLDQEIDAPVGFKDIVNGPEAVIEPDAALDPHLATGILGDYPNPLQGAPHPGALQTP